MRTELGLRQLYRVNSAFEHIFQYSYNILLHSTSHLTRMHSRSNHTSHYETYRITQHHSPNSNTLSWKHTANLIRRKAWVATINLSGLTDSPSGKEFQLIQAWNLQSCNLQLVLYYYHATSIYHNLKLNSLYGVLRKEWMKCVVDTNKYDHK